MAEAGEDEELDFRDQFYRAALEAGLPVKSYGPELAVIDYHGQPTHFRLHALRTRWRALPPEARQKLLFDQLTAPFEERFAASEATLLEVRDHLLPRMGPPEVSPERNPQGRPPSVPIVPGVLHAFVVVNEPATMWFVTEGHLARWGASLEDLLETATENLRKITTPAQAERIEGVDAFIVMSNDSYDASRALLLEAMLSPFPEEGVVVVVPSREVLAFAPVAGPATRNAIAGLLAAGRAAHAKAAYPVTDALFWYRKGKWTAIGVRPTAEGFHLTAPPEFLAAIGEGPREHGAAEADYFRRA